MKSHYSYINNMLVQVKQILQFHISITIGAIRNFLQNDLRIKVCILFFNQLYTAPYYEMNKLGSFPPPYHQHNIKVCLSKEKIFLESFRLQTQRHNFNTKFDKASFLCSLIPSSLILANRYFLT
jgi:hypothetical protein